MDAISQTTLSNAFSWMKVLEIRLKFHWSLFLRVQSTIFQHWFRWWLGAVQATSHYLNQWWLIYWRIYASLGLNDLRQWLGDEQASSHHLNQWCASLLTYICVIRPLCTHLTHWGRDKMAAIFQTTLSNAFLWMKMLEFWLKFHWSLFLRVQLRIFRHLFR